MQFLRVIEEKVVKVDFFLNLRNVTSDARHKNLISLLQIIYKGFFIKKKLHIKMKKLKSINHDIWNCNWWSRMWHFLCSLLHSGAISLEFGQQCVSYGLDTKWLNQEENDNVLISTSMTTFYNFNIKMILRTIFSLKIKYICHWTKTCGNAP